MRAAHQKNRSGSIKSIFRSLRYRNFRLFFVGHGISLIGTWVQRVATPWLVYDLTGSAFMLGVVGFVGQLPTFILAPIAGVYTDRWNKHRLLIATQIAAMIQAFLLTLLFFSETIEIWHIIGLSAALGIINAFDVPVRQSFLVHMVDKKDDLGNAIALNSTMVNSARLIGPSVAGILIVFAGEGVCFLINALSYIVVIAFLLRMKVSSPIKKKSGKGDVFRELREGIQYTFGFSPIRHIILLLALVSFTGMSYTVLMPVYAKEILLGSSHTFGFLMGAAGAGALIGALFLAARKSILGLGRLIVISSSAFGAGLVLFSLSPYFWISLPLVIIIGLGLMLQMASSNIILQTISDDDKRGRVMSFYTMAFMGTAPFGSLLAGSLAKFIGVQYTILAGGIVCILGAIIFARKLPGIRQVVRPLYIKLGIIPKEVSEGIQSATEITVPRGN